MIQLWKCQLLMVKSDGLDDLHSHNWMPHPNLYLLLQWNEVWLTVSTLGEYQYDMRGACHEIVLSGNAAFVIFLAMLVNAGITSGMDE
jgi:hypothetical protein